jgi:ribonuclease G
MAEEILVNVTPQETRVAVIENGMLQEVIIERTQKRGLVGNIYKGRVSRVLPGMGAAFVDAGLSRTAFIHVSDLDHARTADGARLPVEQCLHEGQELVVQVTKDPLGSKGARLTTQISIPSRFLVYFPGGSGVGVSQRIEDETERERLRQAVASADPRVLESGAGGYIVRTAAEGAASDLIQMDVEFLSRLWGVVQERAAVQAVPSLLYEDLPLVLRVLRDLSAHPFEKIRIDSNENHQRVVEFARQFMPELLPRIEHYPGERPILDLYSAEDEIARALNRKVELKSGGYLVIDQTEAMTTIDVNTGTFVGSRNLAETVFRTNLEAAQAIARQLRLRNLGGIIIIDFIDMNDVEHRRQVLRALERAVERDQAKVALSELSSLGLVQLTRKRTRESLEHVLCEPCPVCRGRASVKTVETVCYEIFRELLRQARAFDARQLLVVASQPVVGRLLEEESQGVAELEAFIRRPITFQVEATYHQEQYDVVLL